MRMFSYESSLGPAQPTNTVMKTIGKLKALDDMRSLGLLVRTLGDVRPEVRLAAAQALRERGDERWCNHVKGDAGDFGRLGKSSDTTEVLAALLEALGHQSSSIQAAKALGDFGSPEAAELLLGEVMRNSTRTKFIKEALGALVKIGGEPAVSALGSLVTNWSVPASVRALAARSLGELRHESGLQVLAQVASAPDPKLRQAALEAMVLFRSLCPRVVMLLLSTDSHVKVREAAKSIVGGQATEQSHTAGSADRDTQTACGAPAEGSHVEAARDWAMSLDRGPDRSVNESGWVLLAKPFKRYLVHSLWVGASLAILGLVAWAKISGTPAETPATVTLLAWVIISFIVSAVLSQRALPYGRLFVSPGRNAACRLLSFAYYFALVLVAPGILFLTGALVVGIGREAEDVQAREYGSGLSRVPLILLLAVGIGVVGFGVFIALLVYLPGLLRWHIVTHACNRSIDVEGLRIPIGLALDDRKLEDQLVNLALLYEKAPERDQEFLRNLAIIILHGARARGQNA